MPTRSKRKRILPVFLTVLLIAAVTVATVYAYLKTSTPAVTNSFAADVDPVLSIVETFDKKTKSDVAVQVEKSSYSVYVRAAIVVTWKDEDGNVLATKPVAGTDYLIDVNGSGWFFNTNDGFYYYKAAVAEGDKTDALIKTCKPVDERTPAGYALNVEIIAQAIQAKGNTDDPSEIPAVTDAWGVYVDSDGKLSLSPTP